MVIDVFFAQYADEKSCKEFFKQKREGRGIWCLECGSTLLKWIEKETRWRCRECNNTLGLKQGTVMENSNLKYRIWLWSLFLMSLTKKGFSAMEMQRLVGHSRYEPIWLLMKKIRIIMGHRDDKYTLDDFVEMDEGFFEGHRKKDKLDGKPVKELDRQVKVIVAVSTKPVEVSEQKEHRPKSKAGYVKMSVVNGLTNSDVNYEVEKMIRKSATVITDGRRCYTGLKDICTKHETVIVEDKKEVSKVFPWVHTAISNSKKKILGLHHQVNDAYMQNYLSEFCYKFNRRHFGEHLFDRLVEAALEKSWYKP